MSQPGDVVYSYSRTIPSGGRLDEFELLYRSQVGAVSAFFARRSRNPQLIADLTADTFAEAMSSYLAHGPAEGSERPWLFAIARHVYAKHCERSSRRESAAIREQGRQTLAEDEIEELAERIDMQRSARQLLAALASLPAIEREAIELVHVAGFTPKEAAAALGVSAGTLRVRLFRARARLRKESATNVQF
ncbi:MAG TPA: RNA polymerase sigma factor [Solirubrobacteraceae bacterium]|nr:RNA polymerase sigma factor [Solirubrobacteraceae bacterium]